MFWKFNLITTSHLETLLGKENVTLKELMDEEDILQECKAQTKLLIEFLVRPDVMDELVSLIIQEPAEDIDEKLRYKYPNIACEILTSDVPQINEALVRSETLMAKLLGYLEAEPPLNPLLASFFSKTAGILVSRRADTMFYACMQKENFVNLLLKHIDTSAIMDLLLKFVACADSEILRTSIIQWLDSARVVQQLVALIDPSYSEDHHSNAAEALCEMIKLSREQMSLLQEKAPADPLLDSLESTETVAELLNHMFSSDKTNESVFVNGISVLLSLLEFRKQGLAGQQQQLQKNGEGGGPEGGLGGLGGGMLQGETACFASLFFRSENTEQMTALDVERLRAGVGKVLAAVLPRLGDFLALLADPPQKISWTTTFGLLDPPLGQTRLEVCHLVNALINSNDDGVNQRLADLGALPTILDLFFAYSWNNFLHTQVVHMVSAVMSSAHGLDQEGNKVHPLLDQLLGSCTLVQRCLDAWEANTLEQSQPGKHRRGYMGHLTKIVNDIVTAADNGTNSELVKERLKGHYGLAYALHEINAEMMPLATELPEEARGRWETFINDSLAEVNRKNTMALGGVPNASSTEDDECIDLREVSFHQETALQQSPTPPVPLHGIVFPRSVQQAFSDYQMEQVTSNFVEQFGFNDDEFVEADENLVGQLDQLGRVNFQLPAEVNMTSAALFDRVCREKGQTLDDADSDDDIWEDKEVVLSPATRAQRRLTDDSEEPYSSDSDEEGGATQPAVVASSTDEAKMDVDHIADPDTVAMDTTSPWDSATATAAPDAEGAGWASFDNFANFSAANFETVADTTTPTLPVAMETAEQPPSAPSPAAPVPSPSADEPDSSKKQDTVRLESSSSSNAEVSSAEVLPPAARSAEPVASSSAEINSAEVSSSADANKSMSGASEEGPADSSPACSAAVAALPPPAPACANGPLPSPSPPGDKMAPLDGPHRSDENECDSATTEAGAAGAPSLPRPDATPAAAPTTRPPAPPPPVQNGPL